MLRAAVRALFVGVWLAACDGSPVDPPPPDAGMALDVGTLEELIAR